MTSDLFLPLIAPRSRAVCPDPTSANCPPPSRSAAASGSQVIDVGSPNRQRARKLTHAAGQRLQAGQRRRHPEPGRDRRPVGVDVAHGHVMVRGDGSR